MADEPKTYATLDDVPLPETKPYRVALLGATYFEAEAAYLVTGPGLVHVSKVGTRGQIVNLDEAQARRLLAMAPPAVVDPGTPKGYDEMSDAELVRAAKAKQVTVRSSSLDENMPLRLDYIAALQSHDAGVASITQLQPAPVAPTAPDEPRPEHEGIVGAATPAVVPSTSADPAGGSSTPTPEGDEFSKLAGKALAEAATAAGVDTSTGGTKADGGMKADEVREALRAKAAGGGTVEVDTVVAGAPAATEANVNALATYLQRVTPTPEQTIAIARTNTDDPREGARAVLDAENLITGSDPREAVAGPLQQIIND